MDKNAPWIRIFGLVCIAGVFVYTQDAEFNNQYEYSQTLGEAKAELKGYQALAMEFKQAE